jgi:hypothetical protein
VDRLDEEDELNAGRLGGTPDHLDDVGAMEHASLRRHVTPAYSEARRRNTKCRLQN